MAEKRLRFKAKIEGKEAGVVAAITPPLDVIEWFGTRARVPIRGTINGFPFRSSLMPMGGCHMMPVNKTLCRGAGVKPGDLVEVVMERDEEARTVEVRPDSRRNWRRARRRGSGGTGWHSHTRRRWRVRYPGRSGRRLGSGGWRR